MPRLLLMLLTLSAAAACPACPPPPARCLFKDTVTRGECRYRVDGVGKDLEIDTEDDYFGISCPKGVTLDSASLPSFGNETQLGALTVVVWRCPPPAAPYSDVLRRLGLDTSAAERLELKKLPRGSLQAHHLDGFDNLKLLTVQADSFKAPIVADPALLKPLTSLNDLFLAGVRLAPDALKGLGELRQLCLREAGLSRVPLGALRRLTRLVLVDAQLEAPPQPAAAPALTELTLAAPRSRVPPPAGLLNLTLESMEDVSLPSECGSLQRLTVRGMKNPHTLPAEWVAGCGNLTAITLVLRSLASLPSTLLARAARLEYFKLSNSPKLTSLPPGLFRDTVQLRRLDLSYNGLTSLPSGIFSKLSKLEYLDLTRNKLGGAALAPLGAGALRALRGLALADNPLGDLCPPQGTIVVSRKASPLQGLRALRELGLARTGAVALCDDWRRDLPHLATLDLTMNNITALEWRDLQWERDAAEPAPARVLLDGNPLRGVWVTRAQYDAALAGPTTVEFSIGSLRKTSHGEVMKSPLLCDCNVYWFARALRERLGRAAFPALYCGEPRAASLDRLDLAQLVCPVTKGCPSNCTCVGRPADETLDVRCPDQGLAAVPAVTAPLRAGGRELRLELRLANNSIETLPTSLPKELKSIDLRNNSLRLEDSASVAALFAGGRGVWLAGNPLHCGCGAPLIREMSLHRDQVRDLDVAVCADGASLQRWAAAACGSWAGGALWAAGGAAAALLLTAAALYSQRRHARLWLKAALYKRGLCLRWADPDDDDDCKYDAFLSFSHADAEVARALQARLESGPRPLRLCVHHRDWRVGDWIPQQIAQSVAESRRTVVLLSENFLQSGWARAEFREAYARALREARVRLIVVVLGEGPPAGMDAELSHYVRNNTYVRWGEPGFWEKLRLALPRGREHGADPARTAPASRAAPPPPPAPAAPAPPAAAPPPAPAPVHPAPPAPPTPVVKFAQIDFPAPVKPVAPVTSPCA